MAGSRARAAESPVDAPAQVPAGTTASPTTTPSATPPARGRGQRTTATGRAATGTTAAATAGTRARGGATAASTPAPATGRRRRERVAADRDGARDAGRRPSRALPLVLLLAVVLAASGVGWLTWQRLHPTTLDPTLLPSAAAGVEALYRFDYQNPDDSVAGALSVLTGELKDQYREDLSDTLVDTYVQVSATTHFDVTATGVQSVEDDQQHATVVVFGQYVLASVTTDGATSPSGSECTTTEDGAQSCVQTLQLEMTQDDGTWLIEGVTLLTAS